MVNKLRGIVNVVAIKAPGFGERRKALLQDIAIVTGAEYVAKDLGMKVEAATLEQLGVARKAREKGEQGGAGVGFGLGLGGGWDGVWVGQRRRRRRGLVGKRLSRRPRLPSRPRPRPPAPTPPIHIPTRRLQVTCANVWTTIIADAANKEEIDLRVAQIKKELAETDSVYDTEKLSERVAKLAGGVAVIKVSDEGLGGWGWAGWRRSQGGGGRGCWGGRVAR